jgi:hypothetical protein
LYIAPYPSTFRTAHSAFRVRIVRQFHHVVEASRAVILPDVQDGELAGVRAGDRLEALNAFEFTLERACVAETTPINHLYHAEFTEDVPREPHFAITAPADATEHFVVGNGRR